MANPSGRTGREGEHQAREILEAAGYEDLEREGRRAKALDIVGDLLDTPIEVKKQKNISLPAWSRKSEDAHGDRWGIMILRRDMRKRVHPDMIVYPAEFGAKLLHLYELLEREMA